jgi:pimeloyl-ACP methyl ester carboxylesterase
VYVAGYAPDVAESANQLANSIPPEVDNIKYTFDGFAYYDGANFGRDWAGDLTENRSNYMAVSQPFATIGALGGQSRTVAWRGIPSYGIVATEDRTINPDLQRWMYQRAGSKVTEVKASHAVYISQPEAVAKVIEQAALAAK